jgi:ribonuclease-3
VTNDDDRLLRLAERLGHCFADREVLARALRHGSAATAQAEGSYQRLEFLGDAVLGHAVAELLFAALPEADQGRLTRARAALTRSQALAAKGAALGLAEVVEVGPSEESDSGRQRRALLEDVYEAVVGALAVDGGWPVARAFVAREMAADIAAFADPARSAATLVDAKTALQEVAQAEGRPLPAYVEVGASGPDHGRCWAFEVWWDGTPLGRGEGATKRAAQKEAARRALVRLGRWPDDEA